MTKTKNQSQIKPVTILCECAIMIALATVLSMLKLIDMPYGGSITAFSMVPIFVIAFRHGAKWGLLTGFVYSLIQLLLGASNLSYATSFIAAVAIIFLDYIFAFTFLGLAGMFRNKIKNQAVAATVGATVVCVIRYVCHVISGCTVWAGVSIPTSDGLIYSLAYNAAYMLPEALISIVITFWLFSSFNFRTDTIARLIKNDKSTLQATLSSLSAFSLLSAILFDAVSLFFSIQNKDGYDITLIANANFVLLGIVLAIGIVACIVFAVIAKTISNKNKQ